MNGLQLEPGERFYLGYHEWAVHPLEAEIIHSRGHVTINGVQFRAGKIHSDTDTFQTVNGYPIIKVAGIPGDKTEPQCPGLPVAVRLVREAA